MTSESIQLRDWLNVRSVDLACCQPMAKQTLALNLCFTLSLSKAWKKNSHGFLHEIAGTSLSTGDHAENITIIQG